MILYQHDQAKTFRFVLVGELDGTSAHELQCAWETARSVLRGRELLVDLTQMTAAGPEGWGLLSRMKEAGARLLETPAAANGHLHSPRRGRRRFGLLSGSPRGAAEA